MNFVNEINGIPQVDVQNHQDFDGHRSVSFLEDTKTGLKAYVAIHRKNPAVPSFGATRLWNYVSEADALQDALRLSRIMSYKAALAGLPCGGAKGVIIEPEGHYDRKALLESYADQINQLGGQFITGTDVGLMQEDLPIMRAKSPHIIGLNDNSTLCTAQGLLAAIKVSLKEVFGSESLSERSIAIQGVGKVGTGLLRLLNEEDRAQVYIADINQMCIDIALKIFPTAKVVSSERIYEVQADVFSPSALGSVINAQTVSKLNCRIVAGGANDQLEDESMGASLYEKGILYAPDYVVNAGGLIAVFDEYQYGSPDKERLTIRFKKIAHCLENIFEQSRSKHLPTNIIADRLAERIFNSYH